mgnify:CR=1 FL=1
MNDLTLYINNDCNLACTYCNVEKGGIRLNWGEKIQSIILDIVSRPGERKRIWIMWGEPLIHWDFLSNLIDYINLLKNEYPQKKIYITAIPTNGTIYKKEVYEKLAKNNIELKFSVDTFFNRIDTNRIHVKVKKFDLYKVASQNIKKYQSIYWFGPRIWITISEDNVEEIHNLIKYLIERWEIRSFYFCFVFGKSYSKEFLDLFQKEYIKIFKLYEQYLEKWIEIFPIEDVIIGILKKESLSNINCCWLWKEIIVWYNGYIYSCDWLAGKWEMDYIIWNIDTWIKWEKLWNWLKENIEKFKSKTNFREKLETEKLLCLKKWINTKEEQQISYKIYETLYKIPHILIKNLSARHINYLKHKYNILSGDIK